MRSNQHKIIHPYLGGGVGFSRNKMGSTEIFLNGAPNGGNIDGKSVTQLAYKLSSAPQILLR